MALKKKQGTKICDICHIRNRTHLTYNEVEGWCDQCYKEKEVTRVFDAMDRYAERYGEEALARRFGIGH